jgi:hypothetical protein
VDEGAVALTWGAATGAFPAGACASERSPHVVNVKSKTEARRTIATSGDERDFSTIVLNTMQKAVQAVLAGAEILSLPDRRASLDPAACDPGGVSEQPKGINPIREVKCIDLRRAQVSSVSKASHFGGDLGRGEVSLEALSG